MSDIYTNIDISLNIGVGASGPEKGQSEIEFESLPLIKFGLWVAQSISRERINIRYQLPEKSKVSLKVYDVSGRCVKILVDEENKPGYYKVEFESNGLSTGIYFAKFEAGDYKEVKKLILMR